MPVTPVDIHDVASRLWQGTAVPKQKEATVRSVVSRAYYSAYLSTREAVRAAYSNPVWEVRHAPLAAFMVGSGKPTLSIAGNQLKELLEARKLADYDLGWTVQHGDVEHLVDNAAEIIGKASAIEVEFRSLLPLRLEAPI